MRINRGILKRLSIVLTVLFIVGCTAGIAMPTIAERVTLNEEAHTDCIDAQARQSASDFGHCHRMLKLFSDALDEQRGGIWSDAFLTALKLAGTIWLTIGMTYAVSRWVLNGRTEDASSN